MRKIIYTLFVLVAVLLSVACNDYETYGELKEKERDNISQFISDSSYVIISEDLVKEHGLNAGQMVREAAKLIQGGGGGQPHFASAGGKDPEGITAAVNKIIELVNQ